MSSSSLRDDGFLYAATFYAYVKFGTYSFCVLFPQPALCDNVSKLAKYIQAEVANAMKQKTLLAAARG